MRNVFIVKIILLLFIGTTLMSCAQTPPISTMLPSNDPPTPPFEVTKSEQAWKEQLSPEQYYVLREKGTERSNTGKFLMHKEAGNYTCAACGNILFDDKAKFDSHCGWPSFDREIAAGRIKTAQDNTLGMRRTEIMCAKCGGHLGHVFDDGPTDTGLRYCVNSLSLGFEPANATDMTHQTTNTETVKEVMNAETPNSTEQITLGGGCFWCIEAVFQQLDGVISAKSGYAGGRVKNPTYQEVCRGTTGHAEVVQITFDNTKTNVDEILKAFFTAHDPTTLNQQGADVGTQYRSAIFYHNEQQKATATEIVRQLNEQNVFHNPVVTQIVPYTTFYSAEDYHQNYYNDNQQNSYCAMVIRPKLEKFEKVFKDRLKKTAH